MPECNASPEEKGATSGLQRNVRIAGGGRSSPVLQNEIHFLKRRISVDNFEWHVEFGSKVCERVAGSNGDESLQIDGNAWIEATGEQSKCGRLD